MRKERYLVGLDVGTSKVTAVVGELLDAGGTEVVGLGVAESRGSTRYPGSGCGVRGSGFVVLGSGFGVQGSGFGVLGSRFWVHGSGFGVRGSRGARRSATAASSPGAIARSRNRGRRGTTRCPAASRSGVRSASTARRAMRVASSTASTCRPSPAWPTPDATTARCRRAC